MPLNLVVQTAFLGDLLLSIPLLKRCRELWPTHQLGLVCRQGVGEFFLSTGLVDQVYEIKKGDKKSYSEALQKIRLQSIEHLISPHQSLRTGFFCAQIKAKKKISFHNFWNGLFFSVRQKRDLDLPDALRQLSLLKSLDVSLGDAIESYKAGVRPYDYGDDGQLSAPPKWASMSVRDRVLANTEVYTSLEAKVDLSGFSRGKTVLLFPGSAWATKQWTEPGFMETGNALKRSGYDVVVMGGPGEEALSERVAAAITGAYSLAGKTRISESAQLIARAQLVIANDSASAHLAAACETPLVSIFGPTVLEFGYRPWSAQSYVVERKGLFCRPCGKHGHKQCPLGTHACMKEVSSQQVLGISQSLLNL